MLIKKQNCGKWKSTPVVQKAKQGFLWKAQNLLGLVVQCLEKPQAQWSFVLCTQVYKAKSAKHGKLFTGESFNHQELGFL